MTSVEMPLPPPLVTPRLPRTWYFWGTTILGSLAHGAMLLAQVVVLVAAALFRFGGADMPETQVKAFMHQGDTIAVATIVASPVMLAVLWMAIRLARRRFASYLALRWPCRKQLLGGLAAMFGFMVVWEVLLSAFGRTPPAYVLDSVRTARESGSLWLLLIAGGLVAPVIEEFSVRGFLFRGWSKSFLGPTGAIPLCSALWTLLHTQYGWIDLAGVFLLGLVFGYWRYRSGSTWLTVIMHGTWNTVIMVQVALTLPQA
jgi:hypothetical protein